MLEAFRLEVAHVTLSIDFDNGASTDFADDGLRYYPKANEFVQLRTKVTNLMRMRSRCDNRVCC